MIDVADLTSFKWGTVTSIAPLAVKLDGDTAALAVVPESLVEPLTLAVNDRVRVELTMRKCIIHGKAGASFYSVSAPARNRNAIINGNFRTNQRVATSGTSLASGAYFLDRWQSISATNAVTWTTTAQGRVLTVPSGKAIRTTLEAADVAAGNFVLSWSGTASARVYNAGGSAPSYAASPVLVTLDGTDNVRIEATNGTISEVQLERGSAPSPFERIHLAQELALCQRYFEKSYNQSVAPGAATAVGRLYSSINSSTTTSYLGFGVSFKVPKRDTPTITVYDGLGTAGVCTRNNFGVGITDGSAINVTDVVGETGFFGYSSGSAAASAIFFQWTASADF